FSLCSTHKKLFSLTWNDYIVSAKAFVKEKIGCVKNFAHFFLLVCHYLRHLEYYNKKYVY
ncbi:MAG: hypothetical protein II223_08960, partial [Treponema sp.]|nr:hypothetical protein [Treponema sp.]